MMRLDKFLTELQIGSRSQVKEYLKKGKIQVDGITVKKPEDKVDENTAVVTFEGKTYSYVKNVYYVLNKPAGCVTATEDAKEQTVMEYLPLELRTKAFPVGRLDKDTEGLLFFTNDGELSHFLLSPKRHVDKTYEVTCEKEVTPEMLHALEAGVDIGEKELTLPAKAMKISDYVLHLTIHEGKFHQVKRMLEAVENKVTFLKRLSFGPSSLAGIESVGAGRYLSDEEIKSLYNEIGLKS